jgi:hypothetical protein
MEKISGYGFEESLWREVWPSVGHALNFGEKRVE